MKILGKEIKAAIFDLDGTIIDSTGIWVEIDKEFFGKRGMQVPEHYVDEIAHIGLVPAAQLTKDKYGVKESIEEIIKEWTDASVEQYLKYIQLKPGAKELLETLKNNGIKMAVATANSEDLYLPCLKRLKIDHYFDVMENVKKIGAGKDDIKLYHYVSNDLGYKPEETLIFEDISIALKTGFENGYVTVAVKDKVTEFEEDLKKKYSYKFITNLLEVLD